MNIQLKEIILWPQNKELDIKTINFVEGKVNVIHGLSQTGKSAIVHITDYCLCASENKSYWHYKRIVLIGLVSNFYVMTKKCYLLEKICLKVDSVCSLKKVKILKLR